MSISQDLLPLSLAPRNISITRVSVDKALPALIKPLKALRYVGISTQLSSNGRLKRFAFATTDDVLVVSVDSNPQSLMKMRDTALAELLLGGPVFVGFGIASIALQIHRDIKTHFGDAVDLSTLFSLSTREPWSPSKLIGTQLSSEASFSKIDRLWYGGSGDEASDIEVASRAWISAMYVEPLSSDLFPLTHNPRMADPFAEEIDGSLKVNTKNLAPKELTLLGDLMLQADALVGLKPKENPNDFIRGVLTADGMELENARYQNRNSQDAQTE
ncbi:hypothetical protein B0H12DRAFT_471467 [Mycena haematopus]|nr:hypothetical protein B0H12DRAFT_471467 [Mycena haematopus]